MDTHRPQLQFVLSIPSMVMVAWWLASSDGRIVPWRAAIVLCFVAWFAVAELKSYLRRRARRRAELVTSGS